MDKQRPGPNNNSAKHMTDSRQNESGKKGAIKTKGTEVDPSECMGVART